MKQKIIQISGFIFITFFILSLSVAATINFTFLYSFDIGYLNISEYVDMPKEQILMNYRILLDYLNTPWIAKAIHWICRISLAQLAGYSTSLK